MPDARKVRPVAPLNVRNIGGTALYPWHIGPDEWGLCLADDEFAAAFMPAELFDAVLTAARAESASHSRYAEDVECPLCRAVRAFDAHRQTT